MNRREFMQSTVWSLFTPFFESNGEVKYSPAVDKQNISKSDCEGCNAFIDYTNSILYNVANKEVASVAHHTLEQMADPHAHSWCGDCIYNIEGGPTKQEFLNRWDVDITVEGVQYITVDVELTRSRQSVVQVTTNDEGYNNDR